MQGHEIPNELIFDDEEQYYIDTNTLLQTRIAEAEESGRKAARAGKDFAANPYDPESPFSGEWQGGWQCEKDWQERRRVFMADPVYMELQRRYDDLERRCEQVRGGDDHRLSSQLNECLQEIFDYEMRGADLDARIRELDDALKSIEGEGR